MWLQLRDQLIELTGLEVIADFDKHTVAIHMSYEWYAIIYSSRDGLKAFHSRLTYGNENGSRLVNMEDYSSTVTDIKWYARTTHVEVESSDSD